MDNEIIADNVYCLFDNYLDIRGTFYKGGNIN